MSRQYPSDWDSRRKQVYKRDNYTCQNCGAQGGPGGNTELHAHHIVPKSSGGTHKLTNLKTMCAGCHNAIHGNSIAPSAQPQSDDSTQFSGKIGLNEEDYPYAVLEQVQCSNKAANIIEEHYSETSEVTSDLEGCVDMFSQYSTDDAPFQLVEKHTNTAMRAKSALSTLESQIQEFAEIDTEKFSQKSIECHAAVVEAMEDDADILQVYIDLLKSAGENQLTEDDFVDIRLVKEEATESTSETVDVMTELFDALGSEVEAATAKVDNTNSITPPEFERCPFCESKSDFVEVSKALVRCQDCKAEFLRDGNKWELTNGPSDWVGESLHHAYWEELGKVDFNTNKSKSEIRQSSDRIIRRNKLSLGGIVATSVVGGLFGLSAGNFFPIFAAFTIVAGLAGFISIRYDISQIEV